LLQRKYNHTVKNLPLHFLEPMPQRSRENVNCLDCMLLWLCLFLAQQLYEFSVEEPHKKSAKGLEAISWMLQSNVFGKNKKGNGWIIVKLLSSLRAFWACFSL